MHSEFDSRETGRSGVTAYRDCPKGGERSGARRCGMGFVDCWPMARTLRSYRGQPRLTDTEMVDVRR
ncbi:MAG: hypothetical protein QW392_10655 [Candidatus Jordarchaeales archaeon]